MPAGFREFLSSPKGKLTSVAILVGAIGVLAWSVYANFRDESAASTNTPNFICAETGKPFTHTLQIGDKIPLLSPYSGKRTGYPAEVCFWTKDGKIQKHPTLVLLNHYRNLPEPTFCPDCGRLVVAHNPPPMPNSTPPPTRAEYEANHSKE